MKLTKLQLKQLIKESVREVIGEKPKSKSSPSKFNIIQSFDIYNRDRFLTNAGYLFSTTDGSKFFILDIQYSGVDEDWMGEAEYKVFPIKPLEKQQIQKLNGLFNTRDIYEQFESLKSGVPACLSGTYELQELNENPKYIYGHVITNSKFLNYCDRR